MNEIALIDDKDKIGFIHLNGFIFDPKEIISFIKEDDNSWNRQIIVDLRNGKTRYIQYKDKTRMDLDFELLVKSLSYTPLFEHYECMKSLLNNFNYTIQQIKDTQDQVMKQIGDQFEEITALVDVFKKESSSRDKILKKSLKYIEKKHKK